MTEEQERQAVAAEVATWIGTPYHHEAKLKGEGVDCAQLLYAVFRNCDLIPEFDIDHYPPDWHLHRDAERYLGYILDHATQRDASYQPQPGDIIIWRIGRVFSHGGIVTAWPIFIHAYINRKTNTENADRATYLNLMGRGEDVEKTGKPRERRIYTLNRWMENV